MEVKLAQVIAESNGHHWISAFKLIYCGLEVSD